MLGSCWDDERIGEGRQMGGSGSTTLFREVKIFHGRSDQLSDPTDVLVTGKPSRRFRRRSIRRAASSVW
jgi:hypothetical protein